MLTKIELACIRNAWCKDTSSNGELWWEHNKADGQSDITALLVEEITKNIILRTVAHFPDGGVANHYYNRDDYNATIDLTMEQFPYGTWFEEPKTRRGGMPNKDYLMSSKDVKRRFWILRAKYRSGIKKDDKHET